MSKKQEKKVRTLGKVLFVLYIGFLIYFLFLSDWYGREGVMDEYRYNLELFKEIRRFIVYRRTAWSVRGIFQSFREYSHICAVWIFIAMASSSEKAFSKPYSTAWD